MKITNAVVLLFLSLVISVSSQEDGKILEVKQPVDIVSAVATAERAAKAKGHDMSKWIVTSAVYFGDNALSYGDAPIGSRRFFTKFAKEKGIKLPCWLVLYSPKKITANRVDDYAENVGVTVFVSTSRIASVLAYRFEDESMKRFEKEGGK